MDRGGRYDRQQEASGRVWIEPGHKRREMGKEKGEEEEKEREKEELGDRERARRPGDIWVI